MNDDVLSFGSHKRRYWRAKLFQFLWNYVIRLLILLFFSSNFSTIWCACVGFTFEIRHPGTKIPLNPTIKLWVRLTLQMNVGKRSFLCKRWSVARNSLMRHILFLRERKDDVDDKLLWQWIGPFWLILIFEMWEMFLKTGKSIIFHFLSDFYMYSYIPYFQVDISELSTQSYIISYGV